MVIIIVVVVIIGIAASQQSRRRKSGNLRPGNVASAPGLPPPYQSPPPPLPAGAQISEKYFNMCLQQTGAIIKYLKNLQQNAEFVEFIDSVKGLEFLDDNDALEPYNRRIACLLLHDLIYCYIRLGHTIDPDKKEFLCPSLVAVSMLNPDINLTYSSYGATLRPELRSQLADMYKAEAGLSMPGMEGPYDFLLAFFLNAQNPELVSPYKVMLYRYASLVAKADGTITPGEADYLAGMMKGSPSTTSDAALKESAEAVTGVKTHPQEALEKLIGLQGVKEEVKKLSNFIKVQQLRKEQGLKCSNISYHCVFTGNPGTGKTTVARIIASIYKELGILKKGHLVETDRSGLVAEYVGQTAVKTNKIIDSALDGVLFIDEAYSLVQGGGNDFGIEAISTLLKRMEDERERLVVVLAGYGDEMQTFIDANPGLQSRFNRYIHFDDYSASELIEIFLLNIKNNDYVITDDARAILRQRIQKAVEEKDRNFGNARFVRNLFEKTLENQASRIALQPEITRALLQTIEPADLQ